MAATPIKALLDTAAGRALASVIKRSPQKRKSVLSAGALAVESGSGDSVPMQPSAPEPLPSGKKALHYEITGQLGAGAMGVVYRAYDTRLKRTVALKFFPSHLAGRVRRDRFVREAVAASALDHTNIGTVHAIEETEDGQMFIVMTCYDGETLQRSIETRRMPPLDAVRIAIQIASGLAEAHKAGIVHRDLKPSNVIVTAQGVPKIIDFGIAKLGGGPELTEHGAIIGTAAYMSPEQAMGETADHRSDLWSLGVLLYEMLTGRLPFSADTNHAVMYAIVNRPAPEMPGSALALQAIVKRAMAKRPEERYQSAVDMIRDLAAVVIQDDQSTIFQPSSPAQREQPRRRMLLWISFLVCLLAAISIGVARYTGLWSRVSRPERYIAVLPFQTSATDPAQQALAAGFAEALADSLAALESLNRDLLIVPVSDLLTQKITDVSTVRRQFSVDEALTGYLTHDNGQVRLSLTLVDAAQRNPKLSATIVGTEDRLSEMHTKALAEAVRMLGLTARGDPAPIPKGYASWLRGVGFLERYDKPGNLDAAIAEFEAALRVSRDPLVLVGLSQACRTRYEVSQDHQWLDRARSNVSEAISLDKNLATAYVNRGIIRNIDGDYKAAVEDFERALILNARADEAHRGIGRAFENMGLKERAEEAYRKAIEARPGYWIGYNRLGAFYYRTGKYRKAAEQFRRVVQLTPDNAQGYSSLGVMLLNLRELTAAQQMLESAVRLAPQVSAYHNNLANLHFRRESYPEAARAYAKALDLDRSNYKIWANLGRSYDQMSGHQDKAKDAYRQAAQLAEKVRAANPNDGVVLSELANYYALLGKVSEPLELLGTALSIAPGNSRVLTNAAETYEVLGFREQALTWIAKAIQLGIHVDDIRRMPTLKELVKDSRFEALLKSSK